MLLVHVVLVIVCLSVCLSVCVCPKFVPLVFEHFGNWGNEADKFLDELSKKSVDAEGRSKRT